MSRWFENHARTLPWRSGRTGYSALVAELMLQQTQVSRVIDRFKVFMRKFPNVGALAAADEHDLLRLWQGLGYYRRARHLHQAAKMIVREFGGRVPRTVPELMRLPGVGRYTAGAIASIVYDQPAPIVDGNVQRVLARWFGERAAPTEWTWTKAGTLVRLASQPGVFNEALMELGSLVCTPRAPKCSACPVANMCAARRQEKVNQIPAPRRRAAQRAVHHHAIVITRNGKTLIQQRTGEGMWAGLWQIPTLESDRRLNLLEVKKSLAFDLIELKSCGGFDHHTSHRAIRFHVFRAKSESRAGKWLDAGKLKELPMSSAQRRALEFANADPRT